MVWWVIRGMRVAQPRADQPDRLAGWEAKKRVTARMTTHVGAPPAKSGADRLGWPIAGWATMRMAWRVIRGVGMADQPDRLAEWQA